MSDPRSALDGASAERGLTIRIADSGPVGQVTLKGDLSSPALAAALDDWAGLPVPETWRASTSDRGTAVWMAPDELLLLCGYEEAGGLAARLGDALAGEHHMALDVSDARAVLTLTGEGVAEVLSKGVPADLRPSAFPVGSARRSHVGAVAVVFWRPSEDEWKIACFRSFGQYLFDWLQKSARAGSKVGAF